MNGKDFYDRIQKHALLEWLGVLDERPKTDTEAARPDSVAIGDLGHGNAHIIPVSEVLAHPWKELELVLSGTQRAKIMRGITRVVGYYSQVRNWNNSKKEELKDRGNGLYSVPSKTVDMDGETPQEVMDILAAGGAEMSCDIGGASK